jgi:hypothetical protein
MNIVKSVLKFVQTIHDMFLYYIYILEEYLDFFNTL